jgi:hypothetical protein
MTQPLNKDIVKPKKSIFGKIGKNGKIGKIGKTGNDPHELYECGPLLLIHSDNYDRHVVFDHAVSLEDASDRERFEAVARALRDLLTQRWLLTERTYEQGNSKQVYYLSMEFLPGRTLIHNIINLGVEQFVRNDLRSDPRQNWTEVIDTEPDAGLGNGGLGRLAACFMDSWQASQFPPSVMGCATSTESLDRKYRKGARPSTPIIG